MNPHPRASAAGHDSDAEWERFGQLDPYFGVLSAERFHSEALSPATLREFFESGRAHVDELFGMIRDHVRPDFQPQRGLDFGCGVGRVTIPLAQRCDQVVGVDVSLSMLQEAQKHCSRYAVSNVELFPSDDRLSAVPGSFDFIHSFIVLQHIPPGRGELLIRELLTRLTEGGIAVLHLTYHRRASRRRRLLHWLRRSVPLAHRVANALQSRPLSYPLMAMHNYDLNRVFLLLQDLGCTPWHLRFTDHGGHLGVILLLVKQSSPASAGS